MEKFSQTLEQLLEYCFHLPTLTVWALLGSVLVWRLYEIGLSVGQGYITLMTNQGNIGLYWVHGCCQIVW